MLLRIRLIDFDLHQAGHDLIMAPRMAELGDGAGVVSALVGTKVTSVSAIRMDLGGREPRRPHDPMPRGRRRAGPGEVKVIG